MLDREKNISVNTFVLERNMFRKYCNRKEGLFSTRSVVQMIKETLSMMAIKLKGFFHHCWLCSSKV